MCQNKVTMAKNNFQKDIIIRRNFFEKCHVFLIKLCQDLGDDEKLAFLIWKVLQQAIATYKLIWDYY